MIDIHDNPDATRYEIVVDGVLAGFARYVPRKGRVVMVHTEIGDAYEGQGLAGRLVQWALDDLRTRGLQVVPLCPYVARYIDKHPEYDDLVDHESLAILARD